MAEREIDRQTDAFVAELDAPTQRQSQTQAQTDVQQQRQVQQHAQADVQVQRQAPQAEAIKPQTQAL